MTDGEILFWLIVADLVLIVAAMAYIYWVDHNE
jgi:hypothetical protein